MEAIHLPERREAIRLAHLRFLANAAVCAVGKNPPLLTPDSSLHVIPEDASEQMLRTVLLLAAPLLERDGLWELADRIQAALED